jgi:hypothetical protein
MSSVIRASATFQQSACEDSSGQKELGTENLRRNEKARVEGRARIDELEAKNKELKEQLDEASDPNFIEKMGGFLFGCDGGAAEIGRDMAQTSAALEREQNDLKIQMAEANKQISDLEEAQQSYDSTFKATDEMQSRDAEITDQALI